MQRLKNFLASFFLLSFAYLFYTKVPHFHDYFTVTHNFSFLKFNATFTTFQIFQVFYLFYTFALFVFYFSEKKPLISKSIYCLQGLKTMLIFPVRSFKQGVKPEEKLGMLSVLVKMFFAPLMLSWLFGHITSMLANFNYLWFTKATLWGNFLSVFQSHLFWFLFQLILFADVFFFTLGYLIELPSLKNKILSVEPTLLGWAVTLACYPPFNNLTDTLLPWKSSDFPYFENPFLFVSLNCLLLILMAIYAWASIALNFKASNLTHRGIVSSGPYRYVRHPAYIAKNLAWWIGGIPALIIGFQAGIFELSFTLFSLIGWSLLYFLRALTEERHLASVNNDYALYKAKVPYRFIPKFL